MTKVGSIRAEHMTRMTRTLGRVLDAAGAGQIGAGVGAPVAEKTNDLGLERHSSTPSISREDLLVGEVPRLDGSRGARRDAGAAGLAQRADDVAAALRLVVLDRDVGAELVADAAARSTDPRRPRHRRRRSRACRARSSPGCGPAAARAWATVSGMSFGAWQAPAMKMPSVVVATGSSLGWLSMNQPSLSRLMLTRWATSSTSSRGSMPTMRMTRSAGISTVSPESCSFTSISMPQSSPGSALRITGCSLVLVHEEQRLDLGALAVEVLAALAERVHVDVDVGDIGFGQRRLDLVGVLQRGHAADPRAVAVVLLAAAPDAVDDRDVLRRPALLGLDAPLRAASSRTRTT